jgi:hypothetical protein
VGSSRSKYQDTLDLIDERIIELKELGVDTTFVGVINPDDILKPNYKEIYTKNRGL